MSETQDYGWTRADLRTLRAAILETDTDGSISDPDRLSEARKLLARLTEGSNSSRSRPLSFCGLNSVELSVAVLSLDHVMAVVEDWEFPIRLGASRATVIALRARLLATDDAG